MVAVALILFGAQYPANGFFTAGAFLRQDWLFFLVLSACLVRKRYYALAGGALAWSALLRVFPALFFAGWVVMAIVYFVRHRRIAPAHKRLFAGAAIACAVLVPASIAVTGADAYAGFVTHIRMHSDTPLTNNMGLPQMIAYSEDGREKNAKNESAQDPYANWAHIYRENVSKRRPFFLAIVGGLGVLFVAVTMRVKTLWIAQSLGLLLVTMLLAPTCYYYGFFLLAAVLSRAQRKIEWACFFVGGMSAWLVLFDRIAHFDDDCYYWQSALFVGFALFLVLAFARASKRPGPKPAIAKVDAAAKDSPG